MKETNTFGMIFFDDLDYSFFTHLLEVTLKGDNIYEYDYVDEMDKTHRYYDVDEGGVYYEVYDLLLGSSNDDPEDLVEKKMGNSCVYAGIDGFVPPSENPLQYQYGEVILDSYMTTIDGDEVLLVISKYNDYLRKRFIDMKIGIVVKEVLFDEVGLIKDHKIMTRLSHSDIDESVFEKPSDVEYKDITLFLYSLEGGGDMESLILGLENTLPEEDFSLTLVGDNESNIIIHAEGYDGGQGIDQTIVVRKEKDSNDEEVTLISYVYDAIQLYALIKSW